MSNYIKITDFAAKDSLPSGDPNKIVSGALFADEFNAISAALSTKTELSDILQPAPPAVGRIETYRSVAGVTLNFNDLNVAVPLGLSFDVNSVNSNNLYKLSLTFNGRASANTISTGGRVSIARSSILNVKVINNTTGEDIDLPAISFSIFQSEDLLETSQTLSFGTFCTVPVHAEFFIDFSQLQQGNFFNNYTFSLYHTPTSNTVSSIGNPTPSSLVSIDAGVDMILEELI